MKVSELSLEEQAEIKQRYYDAGCKGNVLVMEVETVEKKIADAGEKVAEAKPISFDTEVFKTVEVINEDGAKGQKSVPQEFELCLPQDLKIELIGKFPAGQSNQHPRNSFLVSFDGETVILSLDLVQKIFKIKG